MARSNKTDSAIKSTRSRKNAKTPEVLQIGVADTALVDSVDPAASMVVVDGAGDALDALLGSLDAPESAGTAPIATDVVIEEAHIEVAGPTDAALEAAVLSSEATEASLALATPEGVVEPGAVPTGTESDVQPEPAAAATPKKVATPRKHYGKRDKATRLADRMGDSLIEYTVLTMEDAGVTEEELKVKMSETLGIIAKMNSKEQNRASMFIEWIAGRKSAPNKILEVVLKKVAEVGHVTTGNEGSLMDALVKGEGYSKASARAMGGNTVSMLADLKVLVADGKQKFVANPASLLLMKANSLLFTAAPDDAAGEPEGEIGGPVGAPVTGEPEVAGAAA